MPQPALVIVCDRDLKKDDDDDDDDDDQGLSLSVPERNCLISSSLNSFWEEAIAAAFFSCSGGWLCLNSLGLKEKDPEEME